MSDTPTVTVLIPARNEEADIERCLRAVLAQDHPHDRMEIVLVDGGSTDGTADLASAVLSAGDVEWKIVENPTGATPSNLNTGLDVAKGDVLCRVDSRSIVPPEYVRLCAAVLSSRAEVSVTGGAQVALPPESSRRGIGIARALNNRYAMGGSRYRSGATSGPTDTVYLGAFRTPQLRAAGGWDEAMLTNQDFELNRRLGRSGVVHFDSRLRVGYIPRRTIGQLAGQYRRFGRWKVRYWRSTGDRPRPRQMLLLVAPAIAAVALAATATACSTHPKVAAAAPPTLVFLALGLESVGTREPAGGFGSRLFSVAAMTAVAAGWLSGVTTELLIRPAADEG